MCSAMFTGTEEDQAEQRDQATIDEVVGDRHMEHGGRKGTSSILAPSSAELASL